MTCQVIHNEFSKINVAIALISAYVLLMCQGANAVSPLPSRNQIIDSPSLTSAQLSVQLASQLSIQQPQSLLAAQNDSPHYFNDDNQPTLALSSGLQTAAISHVNSPKQQEYNQQLLFEHLQLLALGSDDKKFYRYWQMLNKGSEQQKLEYIDTISQDIADFWLAHQVKLPYHLQTDSSAKTEDALASQSLLAEHSVPIDNYLLLEPPVKDYLQVISHLRRLMWLQQEYQWQDIQLDGLLRPGNGHAAVKQISERLWLLGDLNRYDPAQYTYQGELVDAMVKFQIRHGLKPDAVIGPKTLFWINQTPYDRAQLLAQNFINKTIYLAALPARYLLVNIPSYEMFLVDDYKSVLHSRVIVGKRYRQTPLMVGQISNVVINPTWTVPRNLMRLDILPQIKADGDYISQRQFDVFNYQGELVEKTAEQWQQTVAQSFPYRLVQRPGSHNALGRYKFHFNNDSNVYLHDTPTKALFAEADRALSSGCVRIEKVQQLADWFAKNLVIDKRTWNRMQANYDKTQWFSLKDTLPVHFVYWTSWVDNQHQAQYRSDIYSLTPPNNPALAQHQVEKVVSSTTISPMSNTQLTQR